MLSPCIHVLSCFIHVLSMFYPCVIHVLESCRLKRSLVPACSLPLVHDWGDCSPEAHSACQKLRAALAKAEDESCSVGEI